MNQDQRMNIAVIFGSFGCAFGKFGPGWLAITFMGIFTVLALWPENIRRLGNKTEEKTK